MNEVGVLGETLAAKYLTQKGYQIIDRNWRIRGGEIDLVAKIGQTIIFVEVKTRTGTKFGLPEESVGFWKTNFLKRAAQFYLSQKLLINSNYRIDVVAVEFEGHKLKRIEHIESITS